MNKLFIHIILLLLSLSCFSQQKTINGIVRYFPENTTCKDIQFFNNKAEGYSNPAFDDGSFSLNIYNKAKYPTQINIHQIGKFAKFEIVNKYTTNHISPNNYDSIEVFVGNKDLIDERRMDFYKINEKRINNDYATKIKILEDSIIKLNASNQNKNNEIRYLKKVIDSLNTEMRKDKELIKEVYKRVEGLQVEVYLLKNNANVLYDNLIEINENKFNMTLDYFEKGQYEKAVNEMITEEELSRFGKLSEIVFNRIKLNTLIYTAMGKYDMAIYWYDKIRNFPLTEDKEDIERFFIYRDKAELEFRLKQSSKAINDINVAIRKNVNDIYKIEAYNLLGNFLKDTLTNYADNYKRAIELYLEKKKEVGNTNIPEADKAVAISYTLLANYYNNKKKIQSAENNYKTALDLYITMRNDSIPNNEKHLELLIQMAIFYTEARKTSLVTQCNDRIEILTKITDITPEDKAHIDEQMGYLFLKSKEYEKALQKYQSAYYLYAELNKTIPIIYQDDFIRTAFMLGVACNYKKEYKKAIQYCDLTLKEIGDNPNISEFKKLKGYSLALQSNNYKKTKDSKQANDCLAKAKKLAKEINDPDMGRFVRYIELEKMHNAINIFMDWVLPYIGMFPYLYFCGQLLLQ